MSSTPSWLGDPEPEANSGNPSWLQPISSSAQTSANSNYAGSQSQWANDVEQPAAASQERQIVVAGANETTGNPSNTGNGTKQSTTTTGSAAEAAANKTWSQYFYESFRRDGRLLLITLLLIVIMNIPYIQWVLYPFTIFSTWIHEFCHGLAALMAGGKIYKLEIFPDTSGLATTAVKESRRGFVVSAGYQGTAVVGCLLLMFRRTKRGPRTGTMAVGVMMILSVMLWIRNVFGICFILLLGLVLSLLSWRLPSTHMRNLYVCLAATCTLNAITSVQNLFGSTHSVNGQSVSTDANTMSEIKGGGASAWALLWLILALLLALVGFVAAVPGPDEVADFTFCGVCQDLGCFTMCNYPGQRLFSRARESMRESSTNQTTTAS